MLWQTRNELRVPLAALLLACSVSSTGCENDESTAAPTPSAPATGANVPAQAKQGLIEQREDGSVEWVVEPSGALRAQVSDPEGQPIVAPDVGGSVTVGGERIDLRGSDGALTASIGALTAALTDLAYDLRVRGASWQGVLQLPPGGTDALLAQPAVQVPEGQRGPHGGLVEAVGDQRIELLIDEETDEVRVYLLDENLKPVPVGDAEVTVGFVE